MPPEKRSYPIKTAKEKVIPLKTLLVELEKHRAAGRKVVFTNGCFDILHPGHILYMEQARNCGDLLVVGLNTDCLLYTSPSPRD